MTLYACERLNVVFIDSYLLVLIDSEKPFTYQQESSDEQRQTIIERLRNDGNKIEGLFYALNDIQKK